MDIIKFKDGVLNWDDFREWFKERFGWYPNADMPIALRLYLKEQEQEKEVK